MTAAKPISTRACGESLAKNVRSDPRRRPLPEPGAVGRICAAVPLAPSTAGILRVRHRWGKRRLGPRKACRRRFRRIAALHLGYQHTVPTSAVEGSSP